MINVEVDCGPFTVEFFEQADDFSKTQLDDEVFDDVRNTGSVIGQNELRVIYNENTNTTGEYNLGFTVMFTNYPLSILSSELFKVEVIDPCDEPQSLTSLVIDD